MTTYTPRIDVESVKAIDMHVHVEQDDHGCLSLDEELMDASAAYFKGSENRTPTVADLAAQHPDVLIPFGSVDPARGKAGIRLARRLVEEHGVRGFKFHPSFQDFLPNERQHYPLYEELESLGVPALFHTGQTGIGAGLPGGRARLPRCPAGDRPSRTGSVRRRARLPGRRCPRWREPDDPCWSWRRR